MVGDVFREVDPQTVLVAEGELTIPSAALEETTSFDLLRWFLLGLRWCHESVTLSRQTDEVIYPVAEDRSRYMIPNDIG